VFALAHFPHLSFRLIIPAPDTDSDSEHTEYAMESSRLQPTDYFHDLPLQELKKKLNSVAVVSKGTIPTKRPPLVGEVSANLSG
jgi:hypothetical protein